MSFNISRTGRAVLHVTDLEASRKFYVDGLGLYETESDDNHIYLRGYEEQGHHSLLLKKAAKPAVEVISYKVYDDSDLDKIEQVAQANNLPYKWVEKGEQRAIGRAIRMQDVSGLPLEFYAEMEHVDSLMQRYDLYKGARIQRIDHLNCLVPDVQKAYDFYHKEFGFRASEYTEDDEGKLWAIWTHRKGNVHDQAFMNGDGPLLHHVGFWLPDPLALIHACDVLASMGMADNIERGPGRHGLSNAFFLYLRDPDGHRIELYFGDYFTGDGDFKPKRWSVHDKTRQTFWGHEAPDSWFDEASTLLHVITGEEVKQEKAKLTLYKPDFTM
ncbi:3,4-dihydroxyphenylacetate 2,3-dioxygenase [Pseudogracilibacillus auburnensis]|uniref:3,4-dihydroxyphenylacetate 2,3-dioxygenase n=1 Tax=Pseudogracilibacillus auburnensis TaxID=1494959 RepID=A0A2V3VQB2_9BACI|nr:3,4-dihydroxyphenylacetate 2,3-dioxygenase [Pseudogracilibacillus auburnensis]PXW83750.1 3,4-dihydroxyphenylacetate 2,3-dioxygenase [Pseudogracilibacillus auburnensis]